MLSFVAAGGKLVHPLKPLRPGCFVHRAWRERGSPARSSCVRTHHSLLPPDAPAVLVIFICPLLPYPSSHRHCPSLTAYRFAREDRERISLRACAADRSLGRANGVSIITPAAPPTQRHGGCAAVAVVMGYG